MLEVIVTGSLPEGRANVVDTDLVPQLQVTLSRRQHLLLGVGVRVPLTHTSRRPTRVVAYLLWDWFDGGLFEGW